MQTELPTQMAFDLFQDSKGLSITDADLAADIQFRKSNQIISLRADIGLLARKMLNACLFIARPTVMSQETHMVDLEYYKWLCNYDSTNHKHLRAEFKKVRQAASFEIDFIDEMNGSSAGDGGEIAIIVDYMIRGGKVAFSINPRARAAIANPTHYTWLSLRITNSFTSEYALVIYELLSSQKYKGANQSSPTFKTYSDWYTVEQFRIKTNTQHLASYDEFKFLRTRVINPAIKQINAFSDIYIVLETGSDPGSKKITRLRFEIRNNPDGKYQISLPKNTSIDEEIFKTLKDEFGFSRTQIEWVGNTYDHSTITDAVEFVRARKLKGAAENPGGLLVWALKEQMKPTAEDAKRSSAASQKKSLLDALKAEQENHTKESKTKHLTITEMWEKSLPEEKEALLTAFADSPEFLKLKKVRKSTDPRNLEDKMVKGAFNEFLQANVAT